MNPLRGILLKLLSVVVFTAMAAIVKSTAEEIPAGERVFFRSFFAIPVIVLWLAMRHDFPRGLRTTYPIGHFWRSLVGVTAMGCGFMALGLLPFPEAVAIGYAAPLLTVVFAAMFLGERLRIYRLGAVFLGLLGVLVILSPRLSVLEPGMRVTDAQTLGAVVALLGAVFAALAAVFVRRLVQTERTPAIVFYFSAFAALLSLVSLPWGWVMPSPRTAGLLILAGLAGGLGQICLTEAYRHAETSVVAPFEYSSMLLAIAVGYLVFGEGPAAETLAGAGLVVAAGLFIIWREHRLGLKRDAARRVVTPQG
ncbi:MAG: transporter RarD family, DMT superfamily protein [Paracoccaceae bacterium]|nr:MAG: transporter RarD family, DMT superfamily protein [Paracoccaceae bacterium]